MFEAIKPYEYDFPTAILYSSDSGKSALRRCKLEWTIGYSDDHPAIPKDLNLGQGHSLARAILESSKGGVATLFRHDDGILPDTLFKGIKHRGFGDPCKLLLVIPITIYDDSITGFLIVSLNTRRPYDAEYKEWIQVFSNLLGTSAASVALYEEEVRNRKHQEEAAAKDHEALSAEVAVLTQEANEVAEKLQNLHDIANGVGLGYFEFDLSGRLTYANVRMFSYRLIRANHHRKHTLVRLDIGGTSQTLRLSLSSSASTRLTPMLLWSSGTSRSAGCRPRLKYGGKGRWMHSSRATTLGTTYGLYRTAHLSSRTKGW